MERKDRVYPLSELMCRCQALQSREEPRWGCGVLQEEKEPGCGRRIGDVATMFKAQTDGFVVIKAESIPRVGAWCRKRLLCTG